MEIHYRTAVPEDLEQICRLVKSAIDTMIQNNIFQWDAVYPAREDFQSDIDHGQLSVGVTEDHRIAVVYALSEECDEQYQNGNWQNTEIPYSIVHRLCVNPAFQNHGVARRTLLHIEAHLAAQGIHAIRLDAFSQNPYALKLYEKLGYTKVGTADWRKGRFYLLEKYF